MNLEKIKSLPDGEELVIVKMNSSGDLTELDERSPTNLTTDDLKRMVEAFFQKLRYFALVKKIEGSSGHWMLTWQGRDFIRQRHTPHERVKVLHNRIRERSVRRVSIAQVLRTNEPDWLRRDDFIESRPAEAVEQIAMF